MERTEQVYERALKLVPHKKFTFGKLWINFAQFYIRCGDLQKARKIFGMSIGIFPKKKVFQAYINLEEQLCQLDRVRALYEKYCEKFSTLPQPWIEYASFEMKLAENDRAKGILEIANQLSIQGLPDPDEFVENFNEDENDD